MDELTSRDLKRFNALNDHSKINFGQYKGNELGDIPDHYLAWVFQQEWCKKDMPALFDYLEDRLEHYDFDKGYEE